MSERGRNNTEWTGKHALCTGQQWLLKHKVEASGTSVDKKPGHQAPLTMAASLQVCVRHCRCPQRWRSTHWEGRDTNP